MNAVKTGNLIRELRMERGMMQQALADALNMSATSISKWESGHSLPDITLLEPLSSVLDISISELVIGERSKESMEEKTVVETMMVNNDEAIKSVISESVKQRRKAIVKWVSITVAIALVCIVAGLFLFVVGFPAKQSNIKCETEIQTLSDGTPEWVIHFETVDGQPLYAQSEFTSFPSEDGETSISGRIVHLRVAPLGHMNPDNFTCGYSVDAGLKPTDGFDYIIVVDYGDDQVTYSMREEGLFDVTY